MTRIVALGYHGVSDTWPSPMAVTTRALREQVELLLARGYRPATVSAAADHPGNAPLFVVTFDDALASVHALALPILDALGVPATVYAPSEPILSGSPMAWPEVRAHLATPHARELAGMDLPQLRDLLDRGWEIGAHTRTHPWLPRLDDATLADELQRSRSDLQAALGIECTSLAYPFGAHDDRVVAAARVAGYDSAVTLPHRVRPWSAGDDPLRLSRIGVYRADTPARFRLKLSRPVQAIRRTPLWDGLAALR